MRRIISICKEVPLLPIAIIAAIPLALLGSWRPWEAAGVSLTFGPFNPGVGQWIVIALVVYTIVVTVIGMIDDLRHGHVGVDLLAVIAIASTVAVQEYWAAWAVVLMISSGEAIEEFAQSKAEGNLTALVDAAPRTAHVVTLPGVGARAAAAGADGTAGDAARSPVWMCLTLRKRISPPPKPSLTTRPASISKPFRSTRSSLAT